MVKKAFGLLLLFFGGKCIAQDTILKRNNEIIIAQIIGVYPTEIKYRLFNFQDGPLFTDNISEVKSVNYSFGIKEVFEEQKINEIAPLPESPLIKETGNKYFYKGDIYTPGSITKVLCESKDENVVLNIKEYEKNRQMEYIGYIALPFSVGAWCLNVAAADHYNPQILLGTLAAISLTTAISFPIISLKYRRKKEACQKKAIQFYNQKY